MAPIFSILSFAALARLCLAAPHKQLRKREALPDYAIANAPYSYLYSGESYFPSDITTHLANTIPEVDYVAIGAEGSVTVDTLDSYNSSVYLTSANKPSDSAAWLYSDYGIPSNGYSAAPGLIIAAEKNSTTTDVFYFYFYSYNYGPP